MLPELTHADGGLRLDAARRLLELLHEEGQERFLELWAGRALVDLLPGEPGLPDPALWTTDLACA